MPQPVQESSTSSHPSVTEETAPGSEAVPSPRENSPVQTSTEPGDHSTSDSAQVQSNSQDTVPAAPESKWGQRAWTSTRLGLLDMWNTFDNFVEAAVQGLATKLKPHEEPLGEFFAPVTSGAVGYAVFALFNVFGVVTLSRKSPAEALMEDVSNSMANPYFLLAMFLTSLAFVIGSGSGDNFVSRYIIAPFLDLTEHVLMLAVGVLLAYGFFDLLHEVKLETLLAILWLPPALIGVAYMCVLAKRFCRGVYSEAFEKLHRRVLIRVVGGYFAIFLLHTLVHYQERFPVGQSVGENGGRKASQKQASESGGQSAAAQASTQKSSASAALVPASAVPVKAVAQKASEAK